MTFFKQTPAPGCDQPKPAHKPQPPEQLCRFLTNGKPVCFNPDALLGVFHIINDLMKACNKKSLEDSDLQRFAAEYTNSQEQAAATLYQAIEGSRHMFKHYNGGSDDEKDDNGKKLVELHFKKRITRSTFVNVGSARMVEDAVSTVRKTFLIFVPPQFRLAGANIEHFREIEWFVDCLFRFDTTPAGERQFLKMALACDLNPELRAALMQLHRSGIGAHIVCSHIVKSHLAAAMRELVTYDLELRAMLFDYMLPRDFAIKLRREYMGDLRYGIDDILAKTEQFARVYYAGRAPRLARAATPPGRNVKCSPMVQGDSKATTAKSDGSSAKWTSQPRPHPIKFW